jgi:hypothetical protein
MTEAEWLLWNHPEPLIDFLDLHGRAGDRKLTLLGLGCCHLVEDRIQNAACRAAIAATGALLERTVTEQEHRILFERAAAAYRDCFDCYSLGHVETRACSLAAAAAFQPTCHQTEYWEVRMRRTGEEQYVPSKQAREVACLASLLASAGVADMREGMRVELDAEAQQADLTRCVFGNPFRPVTFFPSWLTPTAVGLARGIYDARAFDRLPILADALQDAGCEDQQLLAHCRGGGPHVRGCWVVDGVLGKS